MISFIRTNSENHDFIKLVKLLDAELAVVDGEDHAFYSQFNKIDNIKHTIVLYEDDIPVGCGAIKMFGDDSMEIKRMYVSNEFRNRGLASRILAELEKWAGELNFKNCVLETGIRQPDAIALYTKNGYTLIPNYGQYEGIENSVCFTKKIGHSFENSWGNQTRAESYSKLEFPNTYYLAYRDLPEIISVHVTGNKAVDFGCGTGRSARFLKRLGFEVTGIDISSDMLSIARELDPSGDYHIVSDGKYSYLGEGKFDLVQSIFTFDNIPGWENRTTILAGLRDLLKPGGKIICLDSTPELYTNEWASFSNKDFPENWTAKTGDIVRDVMLDVDDRRPVEDIFWTVEDYHKLFNGAGLVVEETYKPLGYPDEPFKWVSETEIAPWIIFVLGRKA